MQYQSSCAPKLARKCEIEHWFACGVDVRYVGSGEGLPSPLHWEVSRSTLDHHLSGGGSGQLSPRSLSVADQRVKVQFQNLNVERGSMQVQCPKSDVGSENLKDKFENLTVAYEKLNVESVNLNVA